MNGPVIGITTYGRNDEGEFSLPSEYIDAVRRAGGVPILLTPGESDIGSILDLVDGLIIIGGGDLDPSAYGGEEHDETYMVCQERDEFELELVKQVLKTSIPVLAICRGEQLVNVALGGTLHEHLPDVVGEDLKHRLAPRIHILHDISVEKGSLLADILGVDMFSAASLHHQAVKDITPGLKVVASAEDGVIEALERPGHAWFLAVQWHPEITAADDPIQQKIFNAHVEAVKQSLGT